MARPRNLLLAGLALLLLVAAAQAQTPNDLGIDAATVENLAKKCDSAKLDSVSDAAIESCFRVVDGKSCSAPCQTVVKTAGKDCLLALVDATYATDGQDAQGRQALDQLKGTLTKCE